MLSNEKYKGDALLQKTYTVDFLTKKRVENNREVPQYYVEESHPAIIDDVLIKVTAKRFIGMFKEALKIKEFDMELFFRVVEKVIVFEEKLLKVSLLDITGIEVEIE